MNEALTRDIVSLVGHLRAKGIDVGTGQVVAAVASVGAFPQATRGEIRDALRVTLVCTPSAGGVLNELFELVFPDEGRPPPPTIVPFPSGTMTQLRTELRRVLAAVSPDELPSLAERSVRRFGAVGAPGDPVRGWTSRALLSGLRMDELMAEAVADRAVMIGPRFPYQRAAIRAEVTTLATSFEREVDACVTRFSSQLKGIDRVAEHMVDGGLGDIEFLTAPPEEIARLTHEMRPIAHEMRSSLARQRRPRRGPIDVRRSIRRSTATGGLPLTLARRRRRPRRPDLAMLCDLSGSVAGFSSFTLALVAALASEFSRVRMFGFVNRVAEVPVQDIAAWQAMLTSGWREETLCGQHSSSDYGNAIDEFSGTYSTGLGRHCHLLVLGDARTNFYDPRPRALDHLSHQVASMHWLNPELRTLWGTGDSAALVYGRVVPMHEVRTLRQLQFFVRDHLGR